MNETQIKKIAMKAAKETYNQVLRSLAQIPLTITGIWNRGQIADKLGFRTPNEIAIPRTVAAFRNSWVDIMALLPNPADRAKLIYSIEKEYGIEDGDARTVFQQIDSIDKETWGAVMSGLYSPPGRNTATTDTLNRAPSNNPMNW